MTPVVNKKEYNTCGVSFRADYPLYFIRNIPYGTVECKNMIEVSYISERSISLHENL